MTSINIQGMAVCSTESVLSETIGIEISELDASVIPAGIRRRISLPTKLAINAALKACEMADVELAEIPTLFASVGGEMVITDQLCIELTQPDVHISPTQFHNSVHNTAAAYWSIITGSQQASTAMAAGEHTIAMALVEAFGVLATQGGNLLLVCYEESWPEYIDQGTGQHSIAFALLLSTEPNHTRLAELSGLRVTGHPSQVDPKLYQLIVDVPVIGLSPLFQVLTRPGRHYAVPLSFQSQYWTVDVFVDEKT